MHTDTIPPSDVAVDDSQVTDAPDAPPESSNDTTNDSAADSSAKNSFDSVDSNDSNNASDTSAPALVWDPLPTPTPCADDTPAALADAALTAASSGRATFGYTLADFQRSTRYHLGGPLDDPFLIGWQRAALSDPARSLCVGGRVAASVTALAPWFGR